MKKVLFYVYLIGAVFAFHGCPIIGPIQNNAVLVTGSAYIYSPKDSVSVRYYDLEELPHYNIFSPSNYFRQQEWYPEQSEDIPHSEEKHELHVRKLTNYDESIVIEGRDIYINDERWYYGDMQDPADSLFIAWNRDSLRYDTIIIHRNKCPYKVDDIIEQLSLHYPDLIHRLNDMEEHNFSNYQLNKDNKNSPRIYLPENPK